MDEATGTMAKDAESPAGVRPGKKVVLRVGVAVLALGLATAGFFAYAAYDRTRDARTALARASAILEGAELDLLTVDEAVQVEISSVTTTQAVEAAALADSVRESANEAAEIIKDARPNLPEDQLGLATALQESAEARAEMMELAPGILETDAEAVEAIVYADQAVAEIKAAEDLTAQAAAEFNKHTADSVRASDGLSVQAEARLNSAASLLATASASFEGADFTPFRSYIDAKLGLIALAKEIDALWLGGDVAGSNAKLATYNQRDTEIISMAQGLPSSVRDPIANAYEAKTAEVLDTYFKVRERARVAGEKVSEIRQTAVSPE